MEKFKDFVQKATRRMTSGEGNDGLGTGKIVLIVFGVLAAEKIFKFDLKVRSFCHRFT